MIKLLRLISPLILLFLTAGKNQGYEHTTGYIGPYLTLSVDVKDIIVDCSYSKGKGFFGFYAEKNGHLYSIIANSPLPIKDCDALVLEAKRILKDATVVALSGWSRCDGYKGNRLDNALLKKFGGEVYETALFSQISNGKTCTCWFEDCKCLPVDRPR